MKKLAKISKGYSRKVNLRGISSQFDNIECSSMVTVSVSWENEEDLIKNSEVVRRVAQQQTENDIAAAINNLKLLAEDPKNSAMMGLGSEIEAKDLTDGIEGFDELMKTIEEYEAPSIKGIEDLDEVPFGDEV